MNLFQGWSHRMKKDALSKWMVVLFEILLAAVLIYLIYLAIAPYSSTSFFLQKAICLKDGWMAETENGTQEDCASSDLLPLSSSGKLVVSHRIPSDSGRRINTLAFFAVFQDVQIYLDDELLYKTSDPIGERYHFDKTAGSFWIILDLPENCEGRTLTYVITSPYENYRQRMSNTFLGTGTSILGTLLRMYGLRLLLSLFLIVYGFLLAVYALYMCIRYHSSPTLLYLSVLTLCIGNWSLSECHLMQLITGNSSLGTAFSFTAIAVAPVAFLLFFKRMLDSPANRRATFVLMFLFTLQFAVRLILQFFGIRDFYETLNGCIAMLFLVISYVIYRIIVELFLHRNRTLIPTFIAILILAACATIDLFVLHMVPNSRFSIATLIGYMIFSIIVFIQEYHRVTMRLNAYQQFETIREQQQNQLNTNLDYTRRMRHDMRHHLRNIAEMLNQGEYAAAQEYLAGMDASLDRLTTQKFSDQLELNSILYYYVTMAETAGVETSIRVSCDEIRIDAPDLTIILGNILENAVRSASESGVEKPQISIDIRTTGEMLAIDVVNSCGRIAYAGKPQSDDGFLPASAFRSTRKGGKGGIGLLNVSAAAEKYGGTADFRFDEEKKIFESRYLAANRKVSSAGLFSV